MRASAWLASAVVVAGQGCAPGLDELPEVKTPMAFHEPIAPVVPAAPWLQGTAQLSKCVTAAWASKCGGKVSFDVDVNSAAHVREIRFQGDAPAALRRCIQGVLEEGPLLSRRTPDKGRGSATVHGGMTWPRDGGTMVTLAGETTIMPCLRQCTQHGSGGGGGGCG